MSELTDEQRLKTERLRGVEEGRKQKAEELAEYVENIKKELLKRKFGKEYIEGLHEAQKIDDGLELCSEILKHWEVPKEKIEEEILKTEDVAAQDMTAGT